MPAAPILETKTAGMAAVNSIDFVRRTFSLFADGVTAATFRSDADRTRLQGFGVTDFATPSEEKGWARLRFTPDDGDAIAQILFTSGTTGEPKAIALSRGAISNTIRRLNAVMAVDGGIREYVGVPVTYSFGLARARAVSAAGGEFFLPQNGFAPSEIAQMLKRGEINAVSAVPTLWRVLMQNADLLGPERERLRWIEIGSQLMTRPEKEALKALFTNAVIVQHYGLTEASRTTFLSIHETEGDALSSVGRAASPVEIKTDAAGRIMIRGPHVAEFEITPNGPLRITDADGWLTTNDAGSIRYGYLYFEGRLDDLINCGGVKINPDLLERELTAALGAGAEDIAVARLPDAMRGDGLLVALRTSSKISEEAVRTAAIAATAALGINAAGAIKIARVDDFSRTQTGKLKRAAIAEQFLAEAPANVAAPAAASATSDLDAKLVSLWREALGGRTISPQDGFFDLGGDLHAAEALIPKMEAAGVPAAIARGMLDGLSIHEIARRTLHEKAADAGADLEQKILAVWREALGRDDVNLDESFYDIGGDSLTAVTVALNLERAGLAPVLAHGVFDGKTIRELAQDNSGGGRAAPEGDIAPPRKTEVAIFSEASNFMKGVVLLCMIGSHWAPPYLARFGLDDGPVAGFLALFFSLGTPTLAFMFGMGLVVFHARQYQKSRPSFDRNIMIAIALLSFGVIVNGLFETAGAVIAKQPLTLTSIAENFYGPFIYFLVATASLPLWIGRVGKGLKSRIALMFAAIALYGVYAYFAATLPAQAKGEETLANDILVGRWSLLQMGAISLFGAAIGQTIQSRLDAGAKLNAFAALGATMIAGALAASLALGEGSLWFEFPKNISLFTAFFYAGIALVVIAAFRPFTEAIRPARAVRLAVDLVSCIGILLFPLFVLQSFVFRGAISWYEMTGDNFLSMLAALIVAFSLIAAWLIRRVYRIYYAGRQ
ncbi:MAG: AMP-binding protein [Pseudomonadota bacterium]